MDRVCRNAYIFVIESDFDYNQVVNMLQIISDCILGKIGISISNDKISCRSSTNLISHMSRQDELTVIPSDLNLGYTISF